MTSNDRLYGLPGAETMQFDIASVYEEEGWLLSDDDTWTERESATIPGYMEPMPPPGFSFVIGEWTTAEPRASLPNGGVCASEIVERYCEEVAEECYDQWFAAAESDEVKAAFEAALDLLASKVTYRMADKHLADHVITFDDDGEPLVDGEPMYVKAPQP